MVSLADATCSTLPKIRQCCGCTIDASGMLLCSMIMARRPRTVQFPSVTTGCRVSRVMGQVRGGPMKMLSQRFERRDLLRRVFLELQSIDENSDGQTLSTKEWSVTAALVMLDTQRLAGARCSGAAVSGLTASSARLARCHAEELSAGLLPAATDIRSAGDRGCRKLRSVLHPAVGGRAGDLPALGGGSHRGPRLAGPAGPDLARGPAAACRPGDRRRRDPALFRLPTTRARRAGGHGRPTANTHGERSSR